MSNRTIILEYATRIFGDKVKSENWLSSPKIYLNNKTPFEIVETEEGLILAKQYIDQIDYGIYI